MLQAHFDGVKIQISDAKIMSTISLLMKSPPPLHKSIEHIKATDVRYQHGFVYKENIKECGKKQFVN
jgi:hypothetical protein